MLSGWIIAALAVSGSPQAPAAPPEDLPLHGEALYAVPPQFDYPVAALREAIEGRCTISFIIDAAGVPQDILPICTHAIFVEPARRAVAATQLRMGGGIVAGRRFRMPVSFRLGA